MAIGQAQFGGPPFSRRVPRLLVELDPWHRVFWRNLRDLLLRRRPRPLRLTSAPAPFWPDVFVASPVPWGRLRESFLYHVFVIVALWGFSQTYLLRPQVEIEPVTRNTTLTYYQVSEYLPPVFTASAPAKVAQRGEPAYSKQPIISLPANHDNARQTIVNPAAPKLIPHAVKLPNLVVSTPAPEPPVAGATRSPSQLTVPWLTAAPVPPPGENTSRRLSDLNLQSRAPSVVEPPPDLASVERKLGDINVAHAEPQIEAPKLPAPEQRASAGGGEGAKAVPAPPAISVGGSGVQSAGQLIALSLDPAPPSGPIEIPAGNRRGAFAATPEGKPGAPGTPDISAGGTGPGGTAKGGAGGIGNGAPGDPAGIYVGAGPANSTPAAVAGKAPSTFADARKNVIIAAARPAPDIPHETPGSSLPRTPATGSVEQEVFGPRKYYSMILNMPNLTSAGGSWIVRFAALKPAPDPSDLTAPVAVHKVDPAYPTSLMQAHVEGTVTLYAIIRADGSVDGVKILRGVDDTLDENARAALSRWQFRPATRHGVAVDLEAVVQIPFAARKLPF
ncbi:MAG TPA: TonB family protein [Terriglobales bacterium]|nr:TonB family protein [Terriglobales bacterium]